MDILGVKGIRMDILGVWILAFFLIGLMIWNEKNPAIEPREQARITIKPGTYKVFCMAEVLRCEDSYLYLVMQTEEEEDKGDDLKLYVFPKDRIVQTSAAGQFKSIEVSKKQGITKIMAVY